ncbi:hypothetical protein HN51_25470 [Ectopseudomonas mendocina]|uniref:Uncharacterized protein n=1 Tax=Ectopseudomonas mendocina S5.2 TaxID=1225174 RepID=A0ABM5W3L2_ECTME|nr:hypothetical protein DW68_024255 [Pseudomonas mendocina S5.2]KER98149.1 hypothetical protein HN51_25470 [Pseudomonas mendocina]
MRFVVWVGISIIGLLFIIYSGALAHGDAQPVGVFSLLMGCVFVVAGLVGLVHDDKAHAARHVDGDGESKTSGEFWSGLLGSVRELFLGPKK